MLSYQNTAIAVGIAVVAGGVAGAFAVGAWQENQAREREAEENRLLASVVTQAQLPVFVEKEIFVEIDARHAFNARVKGGPGNIDVYDCWWTLEQHYQFGLDIPKGWDYQVEWDGSHAVYHVPEPTWLDTGLNNVVCGYPVRKPHTKDASAKGQALANECARFVVSEFAQSNLRNERIRQSILDGAAQKIQRTLDPLVASQSSKPVVVLVETSEPAAASVPQETFPEGCSDFRQAADASSG